MRVLLVGSAVDRARLRSQLAGSAIDVAGEAPTLAAARASDLDVEAFLVASPLDSPRAPGRDAPADRTEDNAFDEPLTAREIEVLELLCEGLPNKAIAARLDISDQTVKFHVSSICGKLGASNRTEAVRLAARRGLITL
jgi:two-component system, NarL family, response regulator YdfI